MKLSDKTLEMLARVIIRKLSKYDRRYGRLTDAEVLDKLMKFFLDIKEGGHLDVPSEGSYTREILKEHNGTDFIKKAIEKILAPKLLYSELGLGGGPYDASNEVEFARVLLPYLERDNYKLVALGKTVEHSNINGIYYRILDENEFAETPAMEENNQAKNIKEEAEKRFTEENYPATITNCFTLVETVIKDMLDELGIDYKGKTQFVNCYPLLADALNLNPAGENIESHLQKVLQGLKSQVEGLYHLANKASSRHKPEYIPKRQDAKLAMNAAFTLCEYLSDTHKSQQVQ